MTKFNGYQLGERAAMAARGERPIERDPPMIIRPEMVAMAGPKNEPGDIVMRRSPEGVFKPYQPMPGVIPAGQEMAMDWAPTDPSSATGWAVQNAVFHEGQGFFGYPYLAELFQRAEYRHACEIWAEHTTRKWIKLIGGSDEKRKQIWDEMVRLAVRETFQTLALNDHAYGRGQLFLDFGDREGNDAELATPLIRTSTKISKSRPLKAIKVLEPMWSAPGTYSTSNPLRQDFYRPTQWFVYGRTVNATRLLTVTSRPVSDMLKPAYSFGGQSLIQLMKPYVDNWLRTREAVSDLINSFSVMVLKMDMAATLSAGGEQAMFNRVDMFNRMRDNRGTFVIDKTQEEFANVSASLSSLDKLQAQAQEQMASVARIPLSIYLQITPTGLNATSDGETRNFYADVHSYQENHQRPALQVVFECVQLSLFGAIDPEIKFEFIPLWEMSDNDKASIRKSDADADVGYVDAGIVSPEEVRERLSNDETSLYHGVDLTDPPPDDTNDEEDAEPPADGDA